MNMTVMDLIRELVKHDPTAIVEIYVGTANIHNKKRTACISVELTGEAWMNGLVLILDGEVIAPDGVLENYKLPGRDECDVHKKG